jgi:hypothetical protein
LEVFESYQRAVPFLVEMDFDFNEFITAVNYSQKENWEIAELMHEISGCFLLRAFFQRSLVEIFT